MQVFSVKSGDGRSLEVEAVDWMMALSQAIGRLGIEVHGWACSTLPDGTVHVVDPSSGQTFWVREQAAGGQATARSAPTQSLPPEPEPAEGPPEDLAEQLFDRSMELSSAGGAHEACRLALDILLDLIPAEAGSVVKGGLNDRELTFVATAGPAAQALLGERLPFGRGVVGASFDLGISIRVHDVSEDPRHDPSFDERTGFRTRSVLCVPVRDDEGFYGAIELINPPRSFADWHLEAVENIAQSLAVVLAAR